MNVSVKTLQDKGIKATPQRMAIIDFLEKNYSHPTAEIIFSKIKKKYPTMSFATVYNTLEKLESKHEVIKLSIAGGKSCYEYHTHPHCHFYCTKCETIIDIPMPANFEPAELSTYQVEEVHGYFKGVCPECIKKE